MSCNAQVNRSSVFAVVSEDTCGTLKLISAGSSFIPLRAGYSFNANIDEITSDELVDSIGMTKSYRGKESHTGNHIAYLKHSETDAFPEVDPILLNAFGTKVARQSTYLVMASDLTSVKINNNANNVMQVGEAHLVADTVNGYFIRNIASISSDGSVVRYFPALSAAPTVSSVIHKNFMYKPTEKDHPTFSAWLFRANGGSTEALEGCEVTDASMTLNANAQAEITFNYVSKKYYFNPIYIQSSNSKLDFACGSDTNIRSADIEPKLYRTPVELADEIKTKLDAASIDTHTVSFNSFGNNAGKFTLTSSGTHFNLLWQGTNKVNSIGTKIGFTTSANDSGSTSYTSDNVQSYAPRDLRDDTSLTPTYDGADNLILKNADCWIGTVNENYLRKASTVSISMGTPTADIDDLTAETGIYARLKTSREIGVTATILFEKHEAGLFAKFIENTTMSFAISLGAKTSNGNWVPTKCVNIYVPNAVITQHSVSGDDILAIQLSIKGFVDGTTKDIFLNYC